MGSIDSVGYSRCVTVVTNRTYFDFLVRNYSIDLNFITIITRCSIVVGQLDDC